MPTYRYIIENGNGNKLSADLDVADAYYGGTSLIDVYKRQILLCNGQECSLCITYHCPVFIEFVNFIVICVLKVYSLSLIHI